MSVQPTWFNRDLPVLEAVIELLEEQGYPWGPVLVGQIAERSNMDADTVMLALGAMEPIYVTVELNLSGIASRQMVKGVTPEARRAVGQWPTPQTMADRLLASLQVAAEQEDDPAKKSRLRSVVRAVGDIGHDVLVNVITTAATQPLPHH